MFDINNFVINRVVRGVATDMDDGDVLFSLSQIQNPSLTVSSESTDAVDALGVPIATFYRAKSAEFSAESALFDMSLMAQQSGTTKKVAGVSSATVAVPCFENINLEDATVVTTTLTFNLRHVPTDLTHVKIYELAGDGALGKEVVKGDAVDAREKFAIATANTQTTVTIAKDDTGASGFKAKEHLFVMYEYTEDGSAAGHGAVELVNTAKNFPKGCKFTMEVLGASTCDQTNLIYAFIVFPNCKLSPDFDWSIATDSTHPFSMKAMQKYCDYEKTLFKIIIPNATAESNGEVDY